MNTSTSGISAVHPALLVVAPALFAVTGLLHLVPASERVQGSDFEHVLPHAGLWIGIHVAQLFVIVLLAWTVAALTQGISDSYAVSARAALVPFVAFYSAFDASVGLSGGLLARYVSQHPSATDVRAAADAVTNPPSSPVLIGIYVIGVLSWVFAVAGTAVAVRRTGVALTGPVLLGVGAAVFAIDHAAPFGPLGMTVFAIGAVVTARARAEHSRGVPSARLDQEA